MPVFERLREATEAAREGQELPDYLALQIFHIIENREKFAGVEEELSLLVDQVTNYDTYGQTGYLGMGVNNVILEKSLKRLMEGDSHEGQEPHGSPMQVQANVSLLQCPE